MTLTERLSTILKVCIVVAVLLILCRSVYSISLWLLPTKSLTKYQRPSRAWALITGSSAGIGFGCAQELAVRGFNIILLGHLGHELEDARQQISAESPDIELRV